MSRVALDLSGRPFLVWDVAFTTDKIGTFDTQLVREFFQALASAAGITLHAASLAGENAHHVAESLFKALAKALRMAVEPDARAGQALPSTKGALTLTLIDYGSGNIRSVAKAVRQQQTALWHYVHQRMGICIAFDCAWAGAFGQCRAAWRHIQPHEPAPCCFASPCSLFGDLRGHAIDAATGLEDGQHPGFGWLGRDVIRLSLNDPKLKVPHMGWNNLDVVEDPPVLAGLAGRDVYFCHSYAAHHCPQTLAVTDYGGSQVAAVGRENMIGSISP